MPAGFDIGIIESDVRIIQIDPVAYFQSKFIPAVFVFHYFAAAGFVIIVDADFFTDVLFGNSECFFNGNFDRQTVSIPSGFTFDKKSF